MEEMKAKGLNRSIIFPAAAIVVFLSAFFFLVGGMRIDAGKDRPPFFVDEAHKISETYFWRLFAVERDWGNPLWSTDFYARTNPPVPKYIFGLALSLNGAGAKDLKLQQMFEKNQLQQMFEKKQYNPAYLRANVSDDMLRTTRLVSIVFTSLTACLLFLVGLRAGGWGAGLAAPILFLAHPTISMHSRLGLADSILLFFLTLTVPVTIAAVRHLTWYLRGGRPAGCLGWVAAAFRAAVIPGVVVALAAGTRLNGILSAFVYTGGMILAISGRDKGRLGRRLAAAGISAILAGLVAAAIFAGMNPWYHHAPLSRMDETVRLCQDWAQAMQVNPGSGIFTLKEKFSSVGLFTLRSEATPLAGILGIPGMWLTMLGFTAGLVLLAGRAFFRGPVAVSVEEGATAFSKNGTSAGVTLVWILACFLGTILSLPLTWNRYLLVPYEATCLAVAVGLAGILGKAKALTAAFMPRTGRGALLENDGPPRRQGHKQERRKRGQATRPSGHLFAGAGATLVLWLLFTFTPVFIAPELVHPSIRLANYTNRQYERYAAALNKSGCKSAAAEYNRGLILKKEERFQEAEVAYRKALELIPVGGGRGEAIRRLRIWEDLAIVEKALGNGTAAAEALRKHARAVKAIQNTMVSGEAKIHDYYDRIIANDKRLIKKLAESSGSRGAGF